MKRSAGFLIVALTIAACPLEAADKIGEAVYLEGEVGVVRDSREIESSDVQVGMDIENFDLVKTGADALAEVSISEAAAPDISVKVAPNTRFSFEISRLGGSSQSSIGLLAGSLTLKVAKLSGAQQVKVRTDAAAMGVRGTEFTVTCPPSGDILVTCDDGEVQCTGDDGERLRAVPGTAVEKRAEGGLRSIPVAVSDLAAFRENWLAERIEALRANTLPAIRGYAARYETLYARFSRDYEELMKSRGVISRWAEEDVRGASGGRMQAMKEKKQIIGALLKLRKTLFLFERIYYRLLELEEYHGKGYGRGSIRSGLTTGQFFDRFDGERKALEARMAYIRYVAKLYAKRNGGSVPTGAFDEESREDEDFFSE
jgi:hypothetical protein